MALKKGPQTTQLTAQAQADLQFILQSVHCNSLDASHQRAYVDAALRREQQCFPSRFWRTSVVLGQE